MNPIWSYRPGGALEGVRDHQDDPAGVAGFSVVAPTQLGTSHCELIGRLVVVSQLTDARDQALRVPD